MTANPTSTKCASPGPDEQFAAYLRQGKFMIQRVVGMDEYVFYPRIAAPGSGSTDLEWVEALGRGTVYSTSVVRRRAERGGDFNVALIDLAEGPRMMSRVTGLAPDAVTIGMSVVARIGEIDGEAAILFEQDDE